MIRTPLRLALFLTLTLLYTVSAVTIRTVLFTPALRLKLLAENTRLFSTIALRVFGVTVNVLNRDRLVKNERMLIVANHMSYLDILVLASIRPTLFVTSKEVQKQFFAGFMAACGGSLFIDRIRKRAMHTEIDQLANTIAAGNTVTLFPEGTSSDGSAVLPFRSSYLTAAQRAGVTILPVCICYTAVNNEPFSQANRDAVCYYGNMSLLPHLFRFLRQKSVTVTVTALAPEISPAAQTRKELSTALHARLATRYQEKIVFA